MLTSSISMKRRCGSRVNIETDLIYTEKKVMRPLFKLILIYKPCSKLNDFLPKDVPFK